MGANSAGGHGYGPMKIQFEDGSITEIWSPITEISGLIYGPRSFNIRGTLSIKDDQNNLSCEIVFSPNSNTNKKALTSMFSNH